MRQRLVYYFPVPFNNFRTPFPIRFFNRFLNVSDCFIARQNSGDSKKASLHNRVNPSTHSYLLCQCIGINCIKPELFLNHLLLHFARKLIPNFFCITWSIQQKCSTWRRIFKQIESCQRTRIDDRPRNWQDRLDMPNGSGADSNASAKL